MHENMTDMQKVKMVGDPDTDFTNLMAAHHQGGVSMAEEEESNGKDAMLVNMAKKIRTTQQEEMDKLRKFADDHKNAKGDTALTMQMMQPMKVMMANMNHNMSGSTDHHFAVLMSQHHQSGIEMVNIYLDRAKVPEIKAMAQKMKNDQQKEKQVLDKWLQEHKP